MHALCAVRSWYLPAGHVVQVRSLYAVAARVSKVPAVHGAVLASQRRSMVLVGAHSSNWPLGHAAWFVLQIRSEDVVGALDSNSVLVHTVRATQLPAFFHCCTVHELDVHVRSESDVGAATCLLPTAHAVQGAHALWPSSAAKRPAAQSVHRFAPALVEMVPTAHAVQDVLAATGCARPAAQSAQDAMPDAGRKRLVCGAGRPLGSVDH